MSSSLVECAASLAGLRRDVDALSERLEKLGIPRPEGSEWYELLIRKLIPQLGSDNPLIVAVVGGTNTGKSVVFNHIAGDTASGTSPLASGTKHPLCLIPMEFDPDRLGKTFEDFDIRRWPRSDDTLQDCQDHRLFWRHCDSLPHNLLVLDSPDIDSDAVVNWERAEKLRQTADVLIAVLTQQKYNDAAVKRFFQRAATEDLAVVVVFNQCQLPGRVRRRLAGGRGGRRGLEATARPAACSASSKTAAGPQSVLASDWSRCTRISDGSGRISLQPKPPT